MKLKPEVKIYFSRVYKESTYVLIAGIYYVFIQPNAINLMMISNQYQVAKRLKLYKVGEL